VDGLLANQCQVKKLLMVYLFDSKQEKVMAKSHIPGPGTAGPALVGGRPPPGVRGMGRPSLFTRSSTGVQWKGMSTLICAAFDELGQA